ncbi:lipase/acyltransferase domain-containing protein [Bacillus mycoides]|uniref:lipase/acyltransferase domain-containing protein n=1 Tax=Bacillus mycoides TaxID=1405 RepID=UPI003F75609E
MKQIIVIPGIMGSVLKQEGLTIWPKVFPPENFYDCLKFGEFDNLSAEGVEPRTYSKLVEKMGEIGDIVTPFFYDWRQNNLDQIHKLKGIVESDADEVIIVAHSMGGIIAKLCLTYFKDEEWVQKVSKLFTLGTPWKGSAHAYKAIKYGIRVPWETFPIVLRKRDAKKIAPTFPSIYQLLPHQMYNQRLMEEEGLLAIEYDKKQTVVWEDFVAQYYKPLLEENKHEYVDVLWNYYEQLSENLDIEHHEIIGYGKKTISSIQENSLNEPEGVFRNGDGTVPIVGAMSETQHQYFIKEEHQGLAKNRHVFHIIKSVLEGREIEQHQILRTYDEVKAKGFRGKVVKIACPVMISVIDNEGQVIYGNVGLPGKDDIDEMINHTYEVESIGTTTYLFVETIEGDQENTSIDKLLVEAYGEGPTTIAIEEYDSGKPVRKTTFPTFTIDKRKNAEVNLQHNVETSRITIKEDNIIQETLEPVTLDLTMESEDVGIPPKTSYELHANQSLERAGKYLVSGNVILSVDVEEGGFPIAGTFYSVNDGPYEVIKTGELIPLTLGNGENKLRLFSKDYADQQEDVQEIMVYYVEKQYPRIHMKVYSDQYVLQLEESDMQLFRLFGAGEPQVDFRFADNTNVTGHHVVYNEITRVVEIVMHSVFGGEKVKRLSIDENGILTLFEGMATEENFNEVMRGLELFRNHKQPKLAKMDGKGIYRTLTTDHLQNSKRILVENDEIILEIFKDVSHIVSFHNLIEDIQLQHDQSYEFAFKVIEPEGNREIHTLMLNAYVKAQMNGQNFISNDINVIFDEQSSTYKGVMNIEEIRNFADGFWNPQKMEKIELIIQQQGRIRKVLRVLPITIR